MSLINDETINGKLQLWGAICYFTFSKGYLLEITPESNDEENFHRSCKERRGNFDNMEVLHEKNEWDYAFVPAKLQGPLSYTKGTLSLVIDIAIATINSKGPDGNYLYEYEDLTGFTAIDFCGEAIDSVFMPKAILLPPNGQENKIEWKNVSDISKSFPTSINGVDCQLIFTVLSERADFLLDRNNVARFYSVLRIEFKNKQNIDMIEKCWQSVCHFLSFCTGCLNVTDMQIGLWNTDKQIGIQPWHSSIDCKINVKKVDSVQFEEHPYFRFLVEHLGLKTGQLFGLLNDETVKPSIRFLKKNNEDIYIDRDKIRDLCTAYEVEYEYWKGKVGDTNIDLLVKKLKDTVKEYRTENPGLIDEVSYNYIFSSLNFISEPARKKIWYIYNKYSATIDELMIHYDRRIDISKTEKDIAWLVKSRNSITHSTGISESLIPNAIFARLRIGIYCSVLERSGYSLEEIASVLKTYFNV